MQLPLDQVGCPVDLRVRQRRTETVALRPFRPDLFRQPPQDRRVDDGAPADAATLEDQDRCPAAGDLRTHRSIEPGERRQGAVLELVVATAGPSSRTATLDPVSTRIRAALAPAAPDPTTR